VVFIYSGILFSTKKTEILSLAGKWMKLENITLTEISQAQKAKAACSSSYVESRHNINTSIL
jgi:hypothetical protein